MYLDESLPHGMDALDVLVSVSIKREASEEMGGSPQQNKTFCFKMKAGVLFESNLSHFT